VLLVATWGGTERLAAGYLANLVGLALFVAAIGLALGSRPSWQAIVGLFAASELVHPAMLPASAAILVGWAAVELLGARGAPLRERASVRTAAAYAAGSAIGVAILAGVIGLRLGGLQDLAVVRARFDERAAELLAWIDPPLTVAMVLAGVVVAVLRRPRPSGDSARLVAAWLAVSAGGLLVLALVPALPGHRTLLLGVPAPVLGAVALVGGAEVGARRLRPGRGAVAIAAGTAAVAALGVALLAMRPFDERAGSGSPALGGAPGTIAAYLAAAGADRPVVLLMDPAGERGLLAWKARQNAVRALAPDDVYLDVVAYVGDDRSLSAGRPTHRSGPGSATFELVSSRTWPRVRRILALDPIVVAAKPWVDPGTWERLAAASPIAGGNVAILRGPRAGSAISRIRPARLPPGAAALGIGGVLLLLGAVGSGWSGALANGPMVDRIALAPAFGAAAAALVGLAVAIAGADPGGPWGWAAVLAIAAGGWVVARRPEPAAVG
jgi:hypothetical protein